MKITVITTIAQHFKGAHLHLKNLKWAFGEDAHIIVNHFKSHKMPDIQNVSYNSVDADPKKFHFFWDEMNGFLNNDSDFFVFTEQDIFITEKPKYSNHIKLSFVSDYLSLFDLNYKKLYPRIWEGYTFIPGWVVRKAIDENVNFGNHISKSLDWNLDNYYTKYNDWISINDYLTTKGRMLHEGHFDTLFEFTLFCFLNNVKYLNNCIDSYHISSDAVHFRGIDRLCFDCLIYEDLNHIKNPSPNKPNSSKVYEDMINDCAFMLLISGCHKKSTNMKNLICHPLNKKRLLLKLQKLEVHAGEWMNQIEIELLRWSLFCLKNNNADISHKLI